LFDEALKSVNEVRVSALSAHEILFRKKDPQPYSSLSRLSHLSTVDELLGAFRLPVASFTSPNCIRKNTDPTPENGLDVVVFGSDLEVPGLVRGARVSVLPKHVFVSGVTGSTKSNTTLNICIHLHQYSIPFMVIEAAKTEYRILKTLRNQADKTARSLAEMLEVYTPGDETVSRFRCNPLYRRAGISVDEHIDNILKCFLAAMPVEGPLPALIGEALERVYEEYPDQYNPPIMADLTAAAHRVLDEKGYSRETNSDIRSALEVRLGILIRRNIGKIFQCRKSIPSIEHLMKTPSVIEVDRLAQDQKCLLTLFLFTGIREYLKTSPINGNEIRYCIIIEEAHNIVGSNTQPLPSPNIADPKAFASEEVCRMLLEFRALGVAVIIVDPHPSSVAPEVIKSTTTKVAFRQTDKEDRDELGAAMIFGPTEIEEIAP
jgi:hypothetical protein